MSSRRIGKSPIRGHLGVLESTGIRKPEEIRLKVVSSESVAGQPSFQAEAIIGAGRGALTSSMAGTGWLGWDLSEAKAFTGFIGPACALIGLFVFCSLYVIRTGGLARKRYPPVPALGRQAVLKSFLFILLLEVLAIVLVVNLAFRIHRSNLATDCCTMVVGLHFLPLAKVFRAPRLGVIGTLMTLWCALCWALFR
jgi:hypothetical protein